MSAAQNADPEGDGAILPREYYSIGDACDLTGVKPHVLRYWESQFDVLHPQKNRAGRRVFQAKDIELILLLKRLLYQERYSIEGARRRLDEMRRSGEPLVGRKDLLDEELLSAMRADLVEILDVLSAPASGRDR